MQFPQQLIWRQAKEQSNCQLFAFPICFPWCSIQTKQPWLSVYLSMAVSSGWHLRSPVLELDVLLKGPGQGNWPFN